MQVALLGFAVEVGWDGQLADSIQHLGEGHRIIVPVQYDLVARITHATTLGAQGQGLIADLHRPLQHSLFPLLQIAY